MDKKAEQALRLVEQDMALHGFLHGPCIECRPRYQSNDAEWVVELAHDHCVGRSETTDSPSIILFVDLRNNSVLTEMQDVTKRWK